mmetsp:Transcript_14158/g.27274  ORF Transcript_14158/g.27274 Transcript_14158/m.27274 type:complete len:207 (+) Transcript_14158:75-695(+)
MAAVEDEVNELLDEDYDEKDEEEEEAAEDAPAEEKDAAQKEEGHTPTGDEDLEAMKASLQGMEEEEAKLREMQAEVEKEMGGKAKGAAESSGPKEEVDTRSVYVGNVDYAVTPEQLQSHFASCGTVNRVTILTDRFNNPKGFAYVEFLEPDAVQHAVLLNESELNGRKLKVSPKRTNLPGMKAGRGRGRGRGRGGACTSRGPSSTR